MQGKDGTEKADSIDRKRSLCPEERERKEKPRKGGKHHVL